MDPVRNDKLTKRHKSQQRKSDKGCGVGLDWKIGFSLVHGGDESCTVSEDRVTLICRSGMLPDVRRPRRSHTKTGGKDQGRGTSEPRSTSPKSVEFGRPYEDGDRKCDDGRGSPTNRSGEEKFRNEFVEKSLRKDRGIKFNVWRGCED